MMRLAIAIIGCRTVAHAHVHACGAPPELLGVPTRCSRSPEGARVFAEQHGIPRFTGGHGEVPARDAIDVTVLCVSSHVYFEIVMQSLSRQQLRPPIGPDRPRHEGWIDGDSAAMAAVRPSSGDALGY